MASFSILLPIVLQWEGTRYTDDPRDDGGATKYGVTQKSLSDYFGKSASKQDVKNLTVDSVTPIYRKNYWNAIHGDDLSDGPGLIILDGAINHGVSGITKMVQKIVGVNVDGKFGNGTLKAVQDYENQFNLVMAISNARRDLYEHHADFKTFGAGWLNRLKDITNKALAFENKYVVKKPEVTIVEEPDEPIVQEINKPIEEPDVDDFISNETLQKLLKQNGLYDGKIDGLIGSKSKVAIVSVLNNNKVKFSGWSDERRKIAVCQIFASKMGIEVGKIDGLSGPQTKQAFKELNYKISTGDDMPKWRDESVSSPSIIQSTNWPRRTTAELTKFYGEVGKHQVYLNLPYKMKIAWDLKSSVTRFQCHEKVHDSFLKIFTAVLSEYGEKKISDLRLDLFGGCLNVRKMRGGNSWSVHAWGAAYDLDPERNALKMNHRQATFAKSDYDQYWKIVKSVGGYGLGPNEDRDWMHTEMTSG